ncbi:mCG145986, partial [Mus musculus]
RALPVACALDYLLPDATCPWVLGLRWHRVNDTDSGNRL